MFNVGVNYSVLRNCLYILEVLQLERFWGKQPETQKSYVARVSEVFSKDSELIKVHYEKRSHQEHVRFLGIVLFNGVRFTISSIWISKNSAALVLG